MYSESSVYQQHGGQKHGRTMIESNRNQSILCALCVRGQQMGIEGHRSIHYGCSLTLSHQATRCWHYKKRLNSIRGRTFFLFIPFLSYAVTLFDTSNTAHICYTWYSLSLRAHKSEKQTTSLVSAAWRIRRQLEVPQISLIIFFALD